CANTGPSQPSVAKKATTSMPPAVSFGCRRNAGKKLRQRPAISLPGCSHGPVGRLGVGDLQRPAGPWLQPSKLLEIISFDQAETDRVILAADDCGVVTQKPALPGMRLRYPRSAEWSWR